MPRRKLKPGVRVEERLYFAAPHVDGFKNWLQHNGYSPATIAEVVRLLANWLGWASSAGFGLVDLPAALNVSRAAYKASRHKLTYPRSARAPSGAAALFIRYLRHQGTLPAEVPARPAAETWPILAQFRSWMSRHRGLADSTLDQYQRTIVSLLQALGDDPQAYTAEALRAFVLQRSQPQGTGHAKNVVGATRAFLRYLVAMGCCPPGREHAIPSVTSWRLSSLPRFLGCDDVERVIAACDGVDWLRDKAVILLLSRLGLRAGEVAALQLQDLDWHNARIAVHGKPRRRDWLPLTQEIGDAILAYLQHGRSPLAATELFTTSIAPLQPLSRIAVKCLVNRALDRAGVHSPHRGAHILRHSAATAMLRHGVSLAGVGTVLRHTSPMMTAHYAKADFGLLSEMAQPWPGGESC